MDQGTEMRKRIEREIIQVRKDFELARECHACMNILKGVKSQLWMSGKTF